MSPDLTGQRPGLVFSTSLLAESYYLQSRLKLEDALAAARQALRIAPQFAFAWARVAELEFGFGRIPAASEALQKSLQQAPRNAEALALRGFLHAARNKTTEAVAAYDWDTPTIQRLLREVSASMSDELDHLNGLLRTGTAAAPACS